MMEKAQAASDAVDRQKEVLRGLEGQLPESQLLEANKIFAALLDEAGQPKSVSGNAYVRLCGFVESCAGWPGSEALRSWAFSEDVGRRLFAFYLDWSGEEQNRGMKLVLELMVLLRRANPDREAAGAQAREMLHHLLSIIVGKSTKPATKSAMKTLEHFLQKKAFSLEEVRDTYAAIEKLDAAADDLAVWESFFSCIFHWLQARFVSPTAGKLFVSFWRNIRQHGAGKSMALGPAQLRQWLLNYLEEDPTSLELIQNYIFENLFKSERAESLEFLRLMNQHEVTTGRNEELSSVSMLQLSALEAGKKFALVEEPALSPDESTEKTRDSVILHSQIVGNVLGHPDHEVRTLAFSLLVTSSSSTRPYSPAALALLRRHMSSFFAEPDAKFRNDVLSKARDMYRRVRGSICILKRSIPRVRAKAAKLATPNHQPPTQNQQPIFHKTKLIALPEAQLVECLDDHERFLRWYIRFLLKQLIPTAAYQRQFASMKALLAILKSEGREGKTWETTDDQVLFFDLFDGIWLKALFDLTMNRFDDIRDLAATSLKIFYSDTRYRNFSLSGTRTEGSPGAELTGLSIRANELARRTARADHSDGAARVAQLLYSFTTEEEHRRAFLEGLVQKLEQKLVRAEADLGRAVLDAPLHGDFAALCFTWQVVAEKKFSATELEAMNSIQDRLVKCCERVWDAVKSILCDDSPEGHLPQDLEDMAGLDTKDVLSYSFRSVHEASNLMKALVVTIRHKREGAVIPSYDVFSRVGNLSYQQLVNLRHRGAFTTVSATFATCCQLAKHLESQGDEPLLRTWYKGTMDAIFAQTSTTRRSAGIPSLMTGILTANAEDPAFDDVMVRLMEIAQIEARVSQTDGSSLPQVHAYNCLKDIFKNSLLASQGNKVERFLPQCLELAANGLRSEVWAIRNCGLLFLRSLSNCLFGSHESKSTIEAGWDGKANRIAYHRYPSLPGVLVNLLKAGGQQMMEATTMATTMATTITTSAGAEAVFPALDIVRRAGPPDMMREELQGHIATYLASPVWHVREMAARTLCSCLLDEQWLVSIDALLIQALADESPNANNRVHGVLLVLKFVFERLDEVAPELISNSLENLITLLKKSDMATKFRDCPDILAALWEVASLILLSQISRRLPLASFEEDFADPRGGNTCTSALLNIQELRYQIISISQEPDPAPRIVQLFSSSKKHDSNAWVNALEAMEPGEDGDDKLFPSSPRRSLSFWYELDLNLALGSDARDVQTASLERLAATLNRLLADGTVVKELQPELFKKLLARFSALSLNPSLVNAITRVSGCIMAVLNLHDALPETAYQTWGEMMANAGRDSKSFDSRFAAAESMCSFFTAIGGNQHAKSDSRVAGLVALYDALNDDDDEVRTVASRAASRILGRALVPPEAAVHLLSWLGDTFRVSAHFRTLAVHRAVAGHGVGASTGKPCDDGCSGEEGGVADPWAPAAEQLDVALRDDDSLFQQEKQNLFRDDVRETLNWLSVVAAQDLNQASESQGEGKEGDDTLTAWDTWLRGGLARLIPLISDDVGDGPDAPLGWSNNQDALVVCGRIFHSAMYLAAAGKASKELAALWEAFGAAAAARAPGGGSMALERLRMAVTYAEDGVTMTSMET